jgi:hypothetical protein
LNLNGANKWTKEVPEDLRATDQNGQNASNAAGPEGEDADAISDAASAPSVWTRSRTLTIRM